MMEQLLVNVKVINDQIEKIRNLKDGLGSVETLRSQEMIQLNWIKNLGVYWSPEWLVIDRDDISNIIGQLHKKAAEARRLGKKYNVMICESKREQVYYILSKCYAFPGERIVQTSQKTEEPPFYTPYEEYNAETNSWTRMDPWDKN